MGDAFFRGGLAIGKSSRHHLVDILQENELLHVFFSKKLGKKVTKVSQVSH